MICFVMPQFTGYIHYSRLAITDTPRGSRRLERVLCVLGLDRFFVFSSVRRIEEDKFPGWVLLQCFEAILEIGDMDLQFVTVRVEEVERIALAVILLPEFGASIDDAGTERLKISLRYRECDVVAGRILRTLWDVRFQGEA